MSLGLTVKSISSSEISDVFPISHCEYNTKHDATTIIDHLQLSTYTYRYAYPQSAHSHDQNVYTEDKLLAQRRVGKLRFSRRNI